jgi:hypothetical protein
MFDFENTPKTTAFLRVLNACASLLHRDETRTENERTEHSFLAVRIFACIFSDIYVHA